MNLGIAPTRKGKSGRRRQKKNRNNGNQAKGSNHVLTVLGPIRAPSFPKEFSFHSAHYERGVQTLDGTGAFGIVVGIFEFLNRRPLYVAEYFQLYKYCRLTGVDIQFEINNLDAPTFDGNGSDLNAVVGTLPFEDYSAVNIRRLIESPDSVWKTVGNAQGLSRTVIRRSYASQKMFGNPVFATQYWMSQTQSVLTTPQDPRVPICVCAVSHPDAVPVRFSYSVRATYHMQFFDRILPEPSTLSIHSPEFHPQVDGSFETENVESCSVLDKFGRSQYVAQAVQLDPLWKRVSERSGVCLTPLDVRKGQVPDHPKNRSALVPTTPGLGLSQPSKRREVAKSTTPCADT
jgi:hypothetical protein